MNQGEKTPLIMVRIFHIWIPQRKDGRLEGWRKITFFSGRMRERDSGDEVLVSPTSPGLVYKCLFISFRIVVYLRD